MKDRILVCSCQRHELLKVGTKVTLKRVDSEHDNEAVMISVDNVGDTVFVSNSVNTTVTGANSAGYLAAMMELRGTKQVKGTAILVDKGYAIIEIITREELM
jgi:hypothetical protein